MGCRRRLLAPVAVTDCLDSTSESVPLHVNARFHWYTLLLSFGDGSDTPLVRVSLCLLLTGPVGRLLMVMLVQIVQT